MQDSAVPLEPFFCLPSNSNLWITSRHYLKTKIYTNKDHCRTPFKNLKKALTLSFLVIYSLNILTNFSRYIVFQSASRKLNPKFFRKWILWIKWVSFNNLNVIFMTNIVFPLLSFMLNILGRKSILKKRRLVELI